MSTLIGIKYVGLKNRPQPDTVAGTKLVWFDTEQVHFVAEDVAYRLLKHPDVWARTDDVAPAVDSLADLGIVPEADETPKQPEVELPPLVPLDTMDREALIVYAKSHFGQTLPVNMKVENMRAKIHALMNSHLATGQ